MGSFGAVIPVTGLNLGFLGQVSRLGKRTITARQVLSTTTNAIPFGAPVVIVASTQSAGGAYQSVADFINVSSGTFTAAIFAGIAVREVKTNLTYSAASPLAMSVAGSYAVGTICEALEEGSITIALNVTTGIASQGPVFVRVALNGAIPAGIVGDFEAQADGGNTVSLATVGTVFRTGQVDANNTAEVTIRNRVAA